MKKNLIPFFALTGGLILVAIAISMDGGSFHMSERNFHPYHHFDPWQL